MASFSIKVSSEISGWKSRALPCSLISRHGVELLSLEGTYPRSSFLFWLGALFKGVSGPVSDAWKRQLKHQNVDAAPAEFVQCNELQIGCAAENEKSWVCHIMVPFRCWGRDKSQWYNIVICNVIFFILVEYCIIISNGNIKTIFSFTIVWFTGGHN